MNPFRMRLLASLALGLAAAGLGWLYLSSREGQLLRRAQEKQVLVAARYIPAYTRIDPSWLSSRRIPSEYLPRGAMQDPAEITGMLTLAPFTEGEPVLFNKLARSSQSLASAVPEGRRAFTLAVDPVSGVAGLVRPGDYVDLLLLTDEGNGKSRALAATLFQAARVLAAGSEYSVSEKGPAEGGSTVTLALTPRECELALFAQSRGRLHLTLRPAGDRSFSPTRAVDFASVLAEVQEGRPDSGPTVEIIRGSSREAVRVRKP